MKREGGDGERDEVMEVMEREGGDGERGGDEREGEREVI